MYKFEIQMKPRGKKNSRPIFVNKKTGARFVGKDKSLVEHENQAALMVNAQKNIQGITKPLTGKLKWRCVFRFEKKCMADVDNLLNFLFDTMQKCGVVENDRLFRFCDHLVILDETGLPDQTTLWLEVMKPS